MDIRSVILVIAGLLVLVSLAEPFAARLRVPSAVISALLGMAIAAVAAQLVVSDVGYGASTFAETVLNLPFGSDAFLFLFLPILLFHAAIGIQLRDMAEDAVPILVMAVVAVVVATFLIGLAVWPLSAVPLSACLLLGAIVATTDPAAVIAIFRDAGAPQRLTRLLEGESLLNDAAAVTLFAVFIEQLVSPLPSSLGEILIELVIVPLGGILIGYLGGRLCAMAGSLVRDSRVLFATLTLALPFAVIAICEELHVSGFVGVVVAGMTMAHLGPIRTTSESWRYIQDIWAQLSYWASSLLFLLAALLIPRLLEGLRFRDVVAVLAVSVAAFIARAVILFGMMPLLSKVRISPKISNDYNIVMLWGGLRGASTLALALAVAEHQELAPEVKRFVAILATGFVLFTLFVQGVSLRPLVLGLGLHRLNPLDGMLHAQALKVIAAEVSERTEQVARKFGLNRDVAEAITAPHLSELSRSALAEDADSAPSLSPADRTAMALAGAAGRESELVLEKLDELFVSSHIAAILIGNARRLVDALRIGGTEGYVASAEAMLRLPKQTRFAHWLHRTFRIDGPLRARLGDRFEILVVTKSVLDELKIFVQLNITPLFGEEAARQVEVILASRAERVGRELDALKLQFPKYADALYSRMLICSVVRIEENAGKRLYREGLINLDIYRTLSDVVRLGSTAARLRPELDLGLDTRQLAAGFAPFQGFTPQDLDMVSALLQPITAIPGQEIIKRGDRGDACYFISSGAVEVNTGYDIFRLGRGEVFGEMALFTGLPRQADVTAISYCSLLVLSRSDFWTFLDAHPQLRQLFEEVVQDRLEVNQAAQSRGRVPLPEPTSSAP